MPYSFKEHTADIKIEVTGKTQGEIFEQATLALADYLNAGKKVSSSKGKIIQVSGEDLNSLLYNYLDELLYLLDAENFIASKAIITMRGNNLQAELFGDNSKKYKLQHVKAATYSEMDIKNSASHWKAIFVLDV